MYNNGRGVFAVFIEYVALCFDWEVLVYIQATLIDMILPYGCDCATCGMVISPATLPDLILALLFLTPRPGVCPWRFRFAERTPELFPPPLLVAELGGCLGPDGSLPADIDGDGEDVDELIPFV